MVFIVISVKNQCEMFCFIYVFKSEHSHQNHESISVNMFHA